MTKIFIVVIMMHGSAVPVASFDVGDLETCDGYAESINDELSFVEYDHQLKAKCLEK